MTYYKLIQGDKVIGVCKVDALRRHQVKHNLLMYATPINAQYLEFKEKLYRDDWMDVLTTEEFQYEYAKIDEITEEEYGILKEMLDNEEEVGAEEAENLLPTPEPEPEVEETPDTDEITVDYVRELKIKELSLACNKAITAGFDIELSDGEQHHFSMTIQDQANLNAASMQILNGESEVPYHADGEDYRTFSSEDMIAVIGAANQHKMRHLSYYGCLKSWVSSLVRIKSIQSVDYGDDIPKKYQTSLYKMIAG